MTEHSASIPLAPKRPQQPALDPAVVQQAAQWMARLWADDACDADHAACRAWRAAHPDHERAWQRLQVFDNKLQELPQHAAPVLLQPADKNRLPRRRALQVLGAGGIAAVLWPTLRDTPAWLSIASDHSTGVGEIREFVLADGTRLVLDTASAVDVRFDESRREVVLRAGEIFITTAADPAAVARPFIVRSPHGTVRALGTRFTVRLEDDASLVAVYEGAVRIQPGAAPEAALRLDAGQRSAFSSRRVQPTTHASESQAAWSRAMLVAQDMRVEDFVRELGRYRPGFLRCAPEVADLSVTGVFPLGDTDRALANLELALPVQTSYRSRYWVTVHAR